MNWRTGRGFAADAITSRALDKLVWQKGQSVSFGRPYGVTRRGGLQGPHPRGGVRRHRHAHGQGDWRTRPVGRKGRDSHGLVRPRQVVRLREPELHVRRERAQGPRHRGVQDGLQGGRRGSGPRRHRRRRPDREPGRQARHAHEPGPQGRSAQDGRLCALDPARMPGCRCSMRHRHPSVDAQEGPWGRGRRRWHRRARKSVRKPNDARGPAH